MLSGALLFSGYNQRAIIAFCRFSELANISFYIVSKDKLDSIYFSKYAQNIIAERSSKAISCDEIIRYKKLVLLKNPYLETLVIIPSSEYLNRFLVNNSSFLKSHQIIVPLVSKSLYENISDKYSFSKLCSQGKICVPKEISKKEAIKFTHENFPIVAKPYKYFALDHQIYNPLIILNPQSYIDFCKNYDSRDFYLQEFINGLSYYLLFYISRDGQYSVYSQQNFIQQANGKSIIAAESSTIHESPISYIFYELFQSVDFYGLVMVELKLYQDKFYMIEANPRLWGPAQLILDSDMDLFYRFAYDFGLLKTYPSLLYKSLQKYFWMGGILQDKSNGYNIKFHEYRKESFIKDLADFIKSDIYLREDTVKIFFQEMRHEYY